MTLYSSKISEAAKARLEADQKNDTIERAKRNELNPVQQSNMEKEQVNEKAVKRAVKELNPDKSSMNSRG